MAFPSALFGIVTAGMILLVGCGGDAASTVAPLPTPSPAAAATAAQDHVAASLGSPLAGQTAKLEPDGPWVEFLEVVEDSRCPPDVVCIQAGRARIKIRVSSPADALGFGTQELTLEVGSVDHNAGTVTGASGVYLFKASVLDPYAQSSVQKPPDYTATLTVTKTS